MLNLIFLKFCYEIINFSSVTKVGKERIYEIIESYFKNDKKDIEK